MSRIISKYRRYGRTIFKSAIYPYDDPFSENSDIYLYNPFSETGRWRTNNLLYQFRHNKRIPRNSDCPIKTISKRGKLVTMSSVRDLSKQIMSDQKFDY